MALEAKVISLTPLDGLVGTLQAITGVGFQPKALIFFYGGSASVVNQDVSVDAHAGFGFAVSPTKRGATGTYAEDNVSTMNTAVAIRNDCCLLQVAVGGVVTNGRWDLASMDADGFTLIVDEDPTLAPRRVTVICLGGDDITDVDLGALASPAVPGNQDVSGLAFQPDIVFFAATGQAGPLPDDDTFARCCIGVGKDSAEQGVLWGSAEDATADSTTRSYAAVDACLFMRSNAGLGQRAVFVQPNVDGFRLNWTHADTSLPVLFLAIKGGSWRVGNALTATSVSNIVQSGFGFAPKAVMVASHGLTTWNSALVESNDRARILGAADATTESGHLTFEQNGRGTSNVFVGIRFDEILSTRSNSAILGRMGRLSLDADGITFNQTDADTAARRFWYVACGDQAQIGIASKMTLLGAGG